MGSETYYVRICPPLLGKRLHFPSIPVYHRPASLGCYAALHMAFEKGYTKVVVLWRRDDLCCT